MIDKSFFDGRVTLKGGDCRDRIRELPDNSVDAVVTDPPYALVSIVKRFGGENAAPATPKEGTAGAYARASAGFMGKQWDTGETAFATEFWAEVLRVLKPGGHVVAFSGTRTYHRLAIAIEDAGFEIRDQAAWAYGTGFPKSHNVSKAVDRHLGVDREVIGTETVANDMRNSALLNAGKGGERDAYQRDITAPGSPEAAEWDGWGTALKPAWEPIVVARKPLAVPDENGVMRPATVAANLLHWGTGALNIRSCRGDAEKATGWGGSAAGGGTWTEENNGLGKDGAPRPVEGRWPANIMHDGSTEVMDAFPVTSSGEGGVKGKSAADRDGNTSAAFGKESRVAGTPMVGYGDEGSAARFFFSAKAGAEDRIFRTGEEVTVEWNSENEEHRVTLRVDTAQSRPRVTDASGSADASIWNTFLFGNNTTGLSLMDLRSITSTKINLITESKTLLYLIRSLTSESTPGASLPMMDNGESLAKSAESSNPYLNITCDGTAFPLAANNAPSKLQLRISAKKASGGHPTVKPVDLMRWLVRLVCRKGGVVLDPFAGTGTTGAAAYWEGSTAVLIEREPEYQADIERRMKLVLSGPDEKKRARTNPAPVEGLPLFGRE